MSIDWTDVTNIAPDLASLATATQDAILADVATELDPSTLGDLFDIASKNLAAHLGTLAARGALGPGGPVSSETVGPLSRAYAVPVGEDPLLDTTPFGREYRRIIRLNPGRAGLAI